MRSTLDGQRGLIRGGLIFILLLIVAAGVGWYWFIGRFRVPEKAPAESDSIETVLDYAGRRDLGDDPIEQMERPGLDAVTKGGAEAKLHWSNWSAAYVKAKALQLKWKGAKMTNEVSDALPAEQYHREYLNQAQLAEYWRARYVNALEE